MTSGHDKNCFDDGFSKYLFSKEGGKDVSKDIDAFPILQIKCKDHDCFLFGRDDHMGQVTIDLFNPIVLPFLTGKRHGWKLQQQGDDDIKVSGYLELSIEFKPTAKILKQWAQMLASKAALEYAVNQTRKDLATEALNAKTLRIRKRKESTMY